MLYNKPKDITYTQMAITIDNTVYTEECNDELVYEYLYHLSYMLAVKSRYFNSGDKYDEFAILLANKVFLRLKNPKQFDEKYKLSKIKSVLNYLKQVMYYTKLEFEENYYSKTSLNIEDINDDFIPGYTFANFLSDSVLDLDKIEFQYCLDDISKTVKNYLNYIPYKKNSTEWYNIYVSCLLTFLDSICLPQKELDRLSKLKYKKFDPKNYEICYNNQPENVILFHLDNTMRDYICILVRNIKRLIIRDLSENLHTDISNYSFHDYIIYNEINNYPNDLEN